MVKKAAWLLGLLMLGVIFLGCNSKGDSRPQERKADQKKGTESDKDLALKYLQGIQDGDKSKMYEATNLTTDIVNDSRQKLVHSKLHNLTERQRSEYEQALRMSGQIDFFIAKTRKMFPKSSRIEITQTADKGSTDDVRHTEHIVKITYLNKNEAMHDKSGKPVKEMVLHLHQLDRSVAGHAIHELSFTSKDFDKIADREFEVLSYF